PASARSRRWDTRAATPRGPSSAPDGGAWTFPTAAPPSQVWAAAPRPRRARAAAPVPRRPRGCEAPRPRRTCQRQTSWAAAAAIEIQRELDLPHQPLERLDALSSNELSQGDDDRVGFRLEPERGLGLGEQLLGQVERSAHTKDCIWYASGCQEVATWPCPRRDRARARRSLKPYSARMAIIGSTDAARRAEGSPATA